MELLAIRVDVVCPQTRDNFSKWLTENSTRFLIYLEKGSATGKEHFQGAVELDLSLKSIDAWRKNIKDMLKPPGKNQYSLATIKKDSYLSYIAKDKNKAFSMGFSDEEVDNFEEQSYPKEQKGRLTFTEGLYERAKKELATYYMDVTGTKHMNPIPRWKLAEFLIREFCKINKPFDKCVLVRFATMIENKLLIELTGMVSSTLVSRVVEDMM